MDREVFISYSRKDLEEVKKIKYEIDKEVGIDCWMDLDGIESGEQFEDVIIEAISNSKIVLFMMSANSMQSPWALDELDFAKHENKRVVLVSIDNAEMKGKFYFRYHKYDNIIWDNAPQRRKLFKDLRNWTRKEPLVEITTEAGHLEEECKRIKGVDYFARNFTNLRIHGEIDARDFKFLKSFCTMLVYLDISDVRINAYYGPYGTMVDSVILRDIQYEANEIPSGAFFYWILRDKQPGLIYNIPEDEGMHTLREIILPEGITRIRRNAFARADHLTKINIPKGVTKIDWVSFRLCSSLKEIVLPETVVEIEEGAFSDTPLFVVYSRAQQPPQLGRAVFACETKIGKRTLYVPKGSQKAYEESDWEMYFDNIVEE